GPSRGGPIRMPRSFRRMKQLASLLAMTWALSFGHCQAAANSESDITAIDKIANDALAAGPYPGISIAIEQNGKVILEKGYGFADLEHAVPVRPDTIFQIGSVTKSFTALAIMQLIDAGKLSLDTKVGDILTDLPQPAHDLKIRNLLNHT